MPDDDDQPRLFDHERFGAWLKRWMTAEGVSVRALGDKAGLSYGTLQGLRSGRPPSHARSPLATRRLPHRSYGVNVLAALANAMDLPVSYVLARAGLDDRADRWRAFSDKELDALAGLLGGDVADLDALLRDAVARVSAEPTSGRSHDS